MIFAGPFSTRFTGRFGECGRGWRRRREKRCVSESVVIVKGRRGRDFGIRERGSGLVAAGAERTYSGHVWGDCMYGRVGRVGSSASVSVTCVSGTCDTCDAIKALRDVPTSSHCVSCHYLYSRCPFNQVVHLMAMLGQSVHSQLCRQQQRSTQVLTHETVSSESLAASYAGDKAQWLSTCILSHKLKQKL